jgi:hypothetical protein
MIEAFGAALRRARHMAVDRLLLRLAFAERGGWRAADNAADLLARHKACTCPRNMAPQPCEDCVTFALTTSAAWEGSLWRPANHGRIALLVWASYLGNAALHATVTMQLRYDGSRQGSDSDPGSDA